MPKVDNEWDMAHCNFCWETLVLNIFPTLTLVFDGKLENDFFIMAMASSKSAWSSSASLSSVIMASCSCWADVDGWEG